jgi:hypothetical protein
MVPRPLVYSYDIARDELTVNGVTYAGKFFRQMKETVEKTKLHDRAVRVGSLFQGNIVMEVV